MCMLRCLFVAAVAAFVALSLAPLFPSSSMSRATLAGEGGLLLSFGYDVRNSANMRRLALQSNTIDLLSVLLLFCTRINSVYTRVL